jgi:hypothetical protein
MILTPFFVLAVTMAIISLLITPDDLILTSPFRSIAGNPPISTLRQLIQISSASSNLKKTRQAKNKITIESNTATISDTVLGAQDSIWKPITSYEATTDDKPFFDSNQDTEPNMETLSFPYLEYLQTMLASIRFLAINAWHNPHIFIQPEPNLKPNIKLKHEANNGPEMTTTKSATFAKICEVLMLSGVDYPGCDTLATPITDTEKVVRLATSPWSEVDEHGIKWREVREGKKL